MFVRIKQLRKQQNLTQDEFAKRINISRANLGSIEIGRTGVTDRVIADICREFKVSENWLREGIGEMYRSYNEEDELDYLIGALGAKDDKFKRKFITFMLKQPDENWNMIENMIIKFNDYLNLNKK